MRDMKKCLCNGRYEKEVYVMGERNGEMFM